MIGDIIDSVRYQIISRISSPLWGSLFLSWLMLNHQFVWVMFSDLPVESKFALTSLLYSAEFWSFDAKWVWWFIYPLISSMLYIYVYPFISLELYKHWHLKQHEFKEEKQKIEDKTPLTHEESEDIMIRMRKKDREIHELIKDKDQEIADLKSVLRTQEKEPLKYKNIDDTVIPISKKDEWEESLKELESDGDFSRIMLELVEEKVRGEHITDSDDLSYAYRNGLIKPGISGTYEVTAKMEHLMSKV